MSNSISWLEIFDSLNNKTDLTSAQSLWAMNTVMDGNASNDEIKQLLLGLKEKGESPSEITSFVESMLEHSVKLDVFYTDPFIQPFIVIDTIRMASIEEIIAMKMDVIQRGGRKKDFWDLHELLTQFSIPQMITLHEKRYPYSHDNNTMIKNLSNFEYADDDLNPICLRGKYWEFIKDDFNEIVIRLNLT